METNLELLKEKPLWQMNGAEFLALQASQTPTPQMLPTSPPQKNYVFGQKGLASLLQTSLATAWKIKRSGVLDPAISQVGKKFAVDADLAMELLKRSNKRKRVA